MTKPTAVPTGPLPPVYLLCAIALTTLIRFAAPAPEIVRPPWNLLGLIAVFAGVTLNVAGDRAFTRARTAMSPRRAPTTLVTTGPFRYSRNPMYLGMVLIVLGIAMTLNTAAALCVPLLLALALHARFITSEERAMANRFGSEYRVYQARVRRWL